MRVMTFFILCISFFSWSCNPCTSTDTIEIPTEVRDYFGVFKPGNYWVYQTNSLKYDSMYVSYYKDSTVSYGFGNATCDRLKTLSIKIKSNFLNLSSSSSLYTYIDEVAFFYTLSLGTDRSVTLDYINRKLAFPKELKDTITSL